MTGLNLEKAFWVAIAIFVMAVFLEVFWNSQNRLSTPQKDFPDGPALVIEALPFENTPEGLETAIYVGKGWDYVLAWDGPDGTMGVLNYDGSIEFVDRDSND